MKRYALPHLCLAFGCVLSTGHALAAESSERPAASFATDPLPVTLTIDKPGYVTAVIERADGRRVCNLVSEVKTQAGELTLNWDLYDVGVRKGEKEPYTRTLVAPGAYRVRGLVHDGLNLTRQLFHCVFATGYGLAAACIFAAEPSTPPVPEEFPRLSVTTGWLGSSLPPRHWRRIHRQCLGCNHTSRCPLVCRPLLIEGNRL